MTGRAAKYRTLENAAAGIATFLLTVGLCVCLQPELLPTAYARSLRQVEAALPHYQPAALELALHHLQEYPDDVPGIALAAQAAADQSQHDLAIELFRRLPADGGRWEFYSNLGLARRYEILGQLASAERHLRRALELDPQHLEAHERLGNLLQIEGRTFESAEHFIAQIRRGKCRGDELLALATTDRFFRSDERLERMGAAVSAPEALVKLAFARRALFENRIIDAEKLLREILAARPDLGEAQGRLGRILVERGDEAEFMHWLSALPAAARTHPEVWFVQGIAARRQGQMDGAVRCFLETLALSPNHLGANVQIAACLERVGQTAAAAAFARRGQRLGELEAALNLIRANPDPGLIVRAVGLFGALGRFWEAAGWCQILLHLETPPESPRRELRRWVAKLSDEPIDPSVNLPLRLLNRRDFAAPEWKSRVEQPRPIASQGGTTSWRLIDDATRLGIRFLYFEGSTEDTRLQHIFNTMGGGLAALDYDLDGWPDLYLAQAHDWRNPAPQPDLIDRLYRNRQGGQFDDVTAAAAIFEDGFSHGVTVGDIDEDGFPDLYIGNKGPNRLFRNQGDGTFADVTQVAGVAGQEWTTSNVLADFNGDGLRDLYVLNYSLLEETARKECFNSAGRPMACTPDLLVAERDRLYLNRGDGRFQDVSADSGILLPDGRGLGVVAWNFAGDGRLGLFVANDTSPNFFFSNLGTSAAGVPQFLEEAIIRGVGVDSDGKAQASMGVAAGDANGDGRIDLFITTFFGDSKSLYAQRADRYFDDLTRPLELRDPGFWMLGFGCQFADLNGDGWEDLIVTNGDVDQESSRGDADRMPPQVFENLGGKKFAEVPAAALGPFFQGRYLGRGLATLDWNRDGQTDVAISHLHAPFALLTNATPPRGRPLVIRLVGRNGCREPTGAVVRIAAGDHEQFRFQTAGDGFLVTNERRLHFSIPPELPAADVEVRWPGGAVQHWSGVHAGCEVLLMEDRTNPIILYEFPAPE